MARRAICADEYCFDEHSAISAIQQGYGKWPTVLSPNRVPVPVRARADAAWEWLDAQHRPWLRQEARKLRWSGVPGDELFCVARMSLWVATRAYDLKRTTPLTAYARPGVRRELFKVARLACGLSRLAWRLYPAMHDALKSFNWAPPSCNALRARFDAHPVVCRWLNAHKQCSPRVYATLTAAYDELQTFLCHKPLPYHEEPDPGEETLPVVPLGLRTSAPTEQRGLVMLDLGETLQQACTCIGSVQGRRWFALYLLHVIADIPLKEITAALAAPMPEAGHCPALAWHTLHSEYDLPAATPITWEEVRRLFVAEAPRITISEANLRQYWWRWKQKLMQCNFLGCLPGCHMIALA